MGASRRALHSLSQEPAISDTRGRMQQQKTVTMADLNRELAGVQEETMKLISSMINVNVDTLETLNRQIEQTEGDLRKLEGAQADLNEAQKLINSIRRGIFSFESSTNKNEFKLPEKLPNDIDFPVRVDGSKRIIRISTLLYQTKENSTHANVSLPYGYIEGCRVLKDGKSLVLHFRDAYHKKIGKDQWKITLEHDYRLQEFVKALKKRVIQKGLQDSNEREKVADAKPGDRAQFQFILSFEDQSQAFECEEDQIARAQGVVIDLMREYQASVKKAKD